MICNQNHESALLYNTTSMTMCSCASKNKKKSQKLYTNSVSIGYVCILCFNSLARLNNNEMGWRTHTHPDASTTLLKTILPSQLFLCCSLLLLLLLLLFLFVHTLGAFVHFFVEHTHIKHCISKRYSLLSIRPCSGFLLPFPFLQQ